MIYYFAALKSIFFGHDYLMKKDYFFPLCCLYATPTPCSQLYVDGNVSSIVNKKLAAKPESYVLKYLASCIVVFLKNLYGIQSV